MAVADGSMVGCKFYKSPVDLKIQPVVVVSGAFVSVNARVILHRDKDVILTLEVPLEALMQELAETIENMLSRGLHKVLESTERMSIAVDAKRLGVAAEELAEVLSEAA